MNVVIAIGVVVTLVVVLIGWTIQRAVARRGQAANDSADLVQQLINQGVAADVAQAQVVQAEAARKAMARGAGLKLAAVGIGLFLAGLAITGVTYAVARSGGSYYYVTTGLFVGGLITFGRGLSQALTAR
jgi:hypothetical protein